METEGRSLYLHIIFIGLLDHNNQDVYSVVHLAWNFFMVDIFHVNSAACQNRKLPSSEKDYIEL